MRANNLDGNRRDNAILVEWRRRLDDGHVIRIGKPIGIAGIAGTTATINDGRIDFRRCHCVLKTMIMRCMVCRRSALAAPALAAFKVEAFRPHTPRPSSL